MSDFDGDELENYEATQELTLYREYRDVVNLFRYIVETDRRFYLANDVNVTTHAEASDVYFEIKLEDAWVWDIYRTSRFIKRARILSFRDVNVEELPSGGTDLNELTLPDGPEV